MKRLFIFAFVACALVGSVWADGAQRSFKRGFGENTLAYEADLKQLAKGCSWWYNWGSTPPATLAQYMGADQLIEFVPQIWNGSFNLEQYRTYYKAHPTDRYLLGFNEPNFSDQANMTPRQAAEKWPQLEALADELNLILVAPALNIPPGAINDGVKYSKEEWMDGFIAAYKEMYGKEPRYDYLALHCYMDNPDATLTYCEDFARRYGKQVWLTEFCSWESPMLDRDQQEQQMMQKVKMLEQSEYIYRYAWFKARNSNTYPFYNLLEFPNKQKGIEAGTLTQVGFTYVHMSRFDMDKYYKVGEEIPVNEFVDFFSLPGLRESIDPRSRDSVEVYMQGNSAQVTYQIDVETAGDYKLLLRASRPSGSATLKPRINILDGEGNTLISKYTMEPGQDTTTYKAYVLDLNLKAGKQRITIAKDNARACNLSLIRLEKSFASDDPDLETLDGTPVNHGNTGQPDDPEPGKDDPKNTGNENIQVTDADTEPYQFVAGEKYYAIYLDGQTRAAQGIDGDRYVNLGDNGTSQFSYLWDGTFSYGDATGTNSFGVEGNYLSLVVTDKKWSGMGYSVNTTGDNPVDLSGINTDYWLHMALKSTSNETFQIYISDGQGHTANLFIGDAIMTLGTQVNADKYHHLPMANFKRDGKWHNIDIPMSFLKDRFGLSFGQDTEYSGNIFCINAGGEAGTDIAYDAIFFHGPADATPDTAPNDYDLSIASADDAPFRFSKQNRYYVVYLDGETKRDNLSEEQIVDCGPNGQSRQLYPWSDTFDFPAASDYNSFGIGGGYMRAVVTDKNWSGLGYYVGGSTEPLNLTGISPDYRLHFAVKSTYKGILEFELCDALGNPGWIILGPEGQNMEGHTTMGDFPRDDKWYNVEIPIKHLENRFGLNFSTTSNMTGNFFCLLAGGTEGTEVDYDAVFIYGPDSIKNIIPDVTLNEEPITITRIADPANNPFDFSAGYDYQSLYLDSESQGLIAAGEYTNIGPNGFANQLYPWDGTVNGGDASGVNSFGVDGAYMAFDVADKNWSGLGYFIRPGSGTDLSAIDGEYMFHFAVKSTAKDVDYHYTMYDGNGKAAYLFLGQNDAWEDNHVVHPIGDFERDNTWYSIDVPVSWLMRQGLDFRPCTNYQGGNLFTVTAGGIAGTPIHYDAVFFYHPGERPIATAIEAPMPISEESASTSFTLYDLQGHAVATGKNAPADLSALLRSHALTPGIYVVRSGKTVKKIVVTD